MTLVFCIRPSASFMGRRSIASSLSDSDSQPGRRFRGWASYGISASESASTALRRRKRPDEDEDDGGTGGFVEGGLEDVELFLARPAVSVDVEDEAEAEGEASTVRQISA